MKYILSSVMVLSTFTAGVLGHNNLHAENTHAGRALTELAMLGSNSDSAQQQLFTNYAVAFGKTYEMKEFFAKYNTFRTNLAKIVEHNKKADQDYALQVNQFTDMTFDEYKKYLGLLPLKKQRGGGPGSRRHRRTSVTSLSGFAHVDPATLPKSIDWREKKGATYIGPIKDQQACGSCWSFAAVGALETFALTSKQVQEYTPLSEQQLVNCDDKSYGCGGGLMTTALDYVKVAGSCAEKDVPYAAVNQACKSCKPIVRVKSYEVVANSHDALKAALQQGPVAVAISAGNPAFMAYGGGIISDPKVCPNDAHDHGVVAVGYDHDPKTGLDYYIVRNSWGENWGIKGYVKIAFDACGIKNEGYNVIPTA